MKKRKLKRVMMMVIAMLFITAGATWAQRGGNGDQDRKRESQRIHQKERMGRQWMERLDLTADQKEKIDAIHLKSVKQNTHTQNQVREMEAKVTTLMTADDVDSKKINKLIDDISELQAEGRKTKVQNHLAVRELLTEEQRILFDQHTANRKARYGRKRYLGGHR